MNMCPLEGYVVQGPAIGGGIVRRFHSPPDGMFTDPKMIESTGVVQWLERSDEGWAVRATITVTGSAKWSKDAALAVVFDSFLQKID